MSILSNKMWPEHHSICSVFHSIHYWSYFLISKRVGSWLAYLDQSDKVILINQTNSKERESQWMCFDPGTQGRRLRHWTSRKLSRWYRKIVYFLVVLTGYIFFYSSLFTTKLTFSSWSLLKNKKKTKPTFCPWWAPKRGWGGRLPGQAGDGG